LCSFRNRRRRREINETQVGPRSGQWPAASPAARLDRLYSCAHYYGNFFLPVAKLKRKSRIGAKVRRVYGEPMTPYARVLASPHVADKHKALLRETYALLNLVDLHDQIADLRDQLFRTVAVL